MGPSQLRPRGHPTDGPVRVQAPMHQAPPPDAALSASPPAALLSHSNVGLAAGAALWLLTDCWRALPAWAGFA